MTTIKNLLKEKIPYEIQNTVEFNTFLKFVEKSKAKTIDEIKMIVEKDIAEYKRIIHKEEKTNLQGTKRRLLSEHTLHLKFLELVEKKFLKYL